MREVIAKRDKSIFWFFLLGVLITLIINGYNFVKFLNSDLRWVGIFSIACLGIIIFVALFGIIILPNAVLVKEDETLIIYLGLLKKTISWDSVISAEIIPSQNKEKETLIIFVKIYQCKQYI
jgi:hypothetical protein